MRKYRLEELCAYLEVSRSGCYAHLKRKDSDPDQELKQRIRTIYEQRNKFGSSQ